MALGYRLDDHPGRIICALSDGELQEGSVWEAAMAAASHRVDNLVAVIDCNGIQADGPTVLDMEPIAEKWRAFGWDTREIDGNDVAWLATLGIGQIGLGFALLTVGARLIPAAQVGLITLLEVVLGPLWVWLALDERPSTLTLVGGAIVIGAIAFQTVGAPEPDDEPALPAPH